MLKWRHTLRCGFSTTEVTAAATGHWQSELLFRLVLGTMLQWKEMSSCEDRMYLQPQVQTYINNYRRRIAPFLRPGIGLRCTIHPADSGGAVLVFRVGPNIENDDEYQAASPTLGSALSRVEQRAFSGNLEGFTFGGTNVILEQDRIIFIKDGSQSEWSDSAADRDVQSVLAPHRKGQK
jgi:hypothetical protein